MRFRVSAVQDSGLAESFTDALLFLEDWLNGAIGDADFGWSAGCLMVVVFATASLPGAPAASRLVGAAGSEPTLALHVVISPETFAESPPSSMLARVSAAIVRGLPERVVRKPRGLDYDRLRSALIACIAPYAADAV